LSAPDGTALLQVSRLVNRRRAPAEYFLSRRRDDGSWTPLTAAGGDLNNQAPNFAWFSADGCWLHFTRDYSEFKRVGWAAVSG
jgi:hypothetical protein